MIILLLAIGERKRLLQTVRRQRALRSWERVGCYAWWRLTRDIKATQRLMAMERK